MAELTIQISDELAQRLQPLQARLPELLTQLANNIPPDPASSDFFSTAVSSTIETSTYSEVLDFLLARPTPEAIASFKVSDSSQVRLRKLLDKNREGSLSEGENAELDLYEQLDHLMTLLKARAYLLIRK
ncbi:MAG: hypothetical protein LH702_04970 [Phormidesmis sp. CAN_BIN44]|nr:hypothetical protein [Phormidesmis sp. CAN_BIN44]